MAFVIQYDPVYVQWTIEKADQREPKGVQSIQTSVKGKADGKITGVTVQMEWRKDKEETWNDCTGTEIDNLEAGVYAIRYKEDKNHHAGENFYIRVKEGAEQEPPVYVKRIVVSGTSSTISAGKKIQLRATVSPCL